MTAALNGENNKNKITKKKNNQRLRTEQNFIPNIYDIFTMNNVYSYGQTSDISRTCTIT
jgi:hypothetical protein